MILEFVYRWLYKFKEMVIEENVLLKIRVEIDVIIDLFKVSGVIFFYFININSIFIYG